MSLYLKELVKTQKIQYELLDVKNKENNLDISYGGSEKVAWKVDEGRIRKVVMGKTPAEFQKYLKEEMEGKIKDSEVVLWPFWVSRVPTRESRVKVTIKYE